MRPRWGCTLSATRTRRRWTRLGIPQQIRKQRLGHSGNGVTEGYTHTFTQDERAAAEKLGELFGTGWPEKKTGKLIPFPNLSQMQQEPAEVNQQAFANQ